MIDTFKCMSLHLPKIVTCHKLMDTVLLARALKLVHSGYNVDHSCTYKSKRSQAIQSLVRFSFRMLGPLLLAAI